MKEKERESERNKTRETEKEREKLRDVSRGGQRTRVFSRVDYWISYATHKLNRTETQRMYTLMSLLFGSLHHSVTYSYIT